MNYEFRIMNWIRRWRHTLGYGVHSPLAFQIVKDCVHPDSKYGFYVDAYLDFEYHEDRKGLKDARMTIRLVNLLRPTYIWIPNGDKRLCNALKMSFPKIHLSTQKGFPKNADFIICNSNHEWNHKWENLNGLSESGMLILSSVNENEIACLENAPTLTLYGRKFTLLLRRVGMGAVCYELI